jgi:pimeloyl-ACP methyl ester carboxylesterase
VLQVGHPNPMKARPKAKQVTLSDGAELHYCERGAGDALILLHGGMGDMSSWVPQIEAFAAHFRTVSYSRRYSHPNRNSLRLVNEPAASDAKDLAEFMREVGIERAHLVGTSYGALIALSFALKWPARVLSLVLAEPPLHPWVKELPGKEVLHDRFMREVWNRAADLFRRRKSRQAMVILANVFGAGWEAAGSIRAGETLRNVRAMKALLLSEHPFPRLEPRTVQELRLPILVVRGEASDQLHTSGAAELARLAEGCQTAVIAAAGHRASMENPESFNLVVLDFLRRCPERDARRDPPRSP